MGKEIVAMILAGGRGTRLKELTAKVAKPAVYFGGKYRIIDFPLSNCANSGIDVVGVLTQYESVLLGTYVGSGTKWGLDGNNSLAAILPARERGEVGATWYAGTADAIYQNISFLDQYDPEYVLILSGDHIYKMDYEEMLNVHKEKGADLTVAVLNVSLKEASRFGIMNTDDKGYIYEFEEKPEKPKSTLASMGIYIFSYKELRKYLIADAADENSKHDFGMNIIPAMLADKKKLYAWTFDGYWKDVGTVESLWQANMDLLDDKELDLYNIKKDWKIYSEDTLGKPQLIGKDASVKNSLVTQGCVVNGEVEGSVLFNNVNVGEGAKVIDSVLMPGVLIEEGAVVKKAIIDEGVVVKAGTVVNDEAKEVALVSDNGR
ncbi:MULTISPECIES: glucose-1-phosphate adenylyltransferase [Catenibacterium]|jgi:glucose-1-phosphate adenylyltransferase|uniref:Glucose-1-phosphate adenylyltransferase n=1 Tax=Catenibacterium faecis TaxID=2764323 RepID=A0ABR7K9W2_9FIRM|nr:MULTISPECIES: glucose-1-phosphate adenylyltransferase [Catenibacterium]HCV46765.1 glucose-1-phosphate adenylyltransferase [Catenibacterium sp.]MBC6009503.1 glucose-1-phosphate adenylyltransferase [Catenibacterium faecis]MBU9057600.1 glucose-1-phosphate adenylyltransferase [Catenibacterium mitsuokai]MCB5428315.1 glucose-1-phosphate adenylyltransferase [Catenibacterium mitsuokai]RGE96115.1 glucose-1-phosphate adenylyltransferase [Catenibacterium sp. AM22-6LB]